MMNRTIIPIETLRGLVASSTTTLRGLVASSTTTLRGLVASSTTTLPGIGTGYRMKPLARHARSIFAAGVKAVRGDVLIRDSVRFERDVICLGDHEVDRRRVGRLVLVGAGKASGAMTIGLIERYRMDESETGSIGFVGHVNVPDGCQSIPAALDWPVDLTLFPARPAGVNEPTEAAIRGTDEILRRVREAGPRDLVVVLLSGGGSALLARPSGTLTLDDQLAVIRRLSGDGADITQLNTVRKHLSDVKGGRLAAACVNAPMVALVLSDVLGDPLDLIASGPTVPDSSTPQDAIEVLETFDPDRTLPAAIYRCLEDQMKRPLRSFPADRVVTIVVGNNAVAVDAAGIVAESLGYNHVMQSARRCEGDAETIGRHLADMTLEMLRRDVHQHRQDALITGGEPTVKLAPEPRRGMGGRNQQLVLAAYQRLREHELAPEQWDRIAILSGGTDGEDGPTDAAGGWIDASVHTEAVKQSLNPATFLARNDAYTFLQRTGGLLITGPTGTNVCDIRVALVDRGCIEG